MAFERKCADSGGVSSLQVGKIQKGAGGAVGIWRLGVLRGESRGCWEMRVKNGGARVTGQDDGAQPQKSLQNPPWS